MPTNPCRLAWGVLLIASAALMSSAPAHAQYVYLDVNGDGRSDASDVLGPDVTSVDIYLDTAHDATGKAVACTVGIDPDEPNPSMTIGSYAFTLEWEPAGSGDLKYGSWSDNMGFTIPAGGMQQGKMFWTARAAAYSLAPGRYMLGSLRVKVTGHPVLRFLSSSSYDNTAMTAFGCACGGRDYDNTIKLGSDFLDARGTSPPEEGPRTAWGVVKELYR